jgi:hypothetical protein
MQFAEPNRVEPNGVAELDLGDDVVIALLLGIPGAQGSWSKNPKRMLPPAARFLG